MLFLLDGLYENLRAVEEEAISKKITAETADHLDMLHCSLHEIIKGLEQQAI